MTRPSTFATSSPPAPGAWKRKLKRAGLILIVLLAAYFGGLITWLYRNWTELDSVETGPTPSVVVAIKQLARLETSSFHIEKVIDLADKQSLLFGLIEAEDAILLVAVGEVIAGVDLALVDAADIEIDPEKRSARIALPAPQVFSSHLDPARSYVHKRSTDALAQRSKDLEAKARAQAVKVIRKAAEDAGILDVARRNAYRTVVGLIRSLGYDQVEVTWK